MQNFELNQHNYGTPKLSLWAWAANAIALASTIAAHYGSVPESADLCFYPVAAQNHDAKLREVRSLESTDVLGRYESESNLLFGRQYCNVERGQIGTVPKSYLTKAYSSSVNPKVSDLATLSQGMREGWLYTFTNVPAENPYKLPLGVSAIAFGILGLILHHKQQDAIASIRPKYRATKRLAGVEARYAIAFAEESLQIAGAALKAKIQALKEADARTYFINALTPQQKQALLVSINDEQYYEYGYLLDGGKSFHLFADHTPENGQEVAMLPQQAQVEPTGSPADTPQQSKQYTKTDHLAAKDKFQPYREIGLSILKQAGSPGKSKALVAPSRTGKTTVIYFMLEEAYRILGENLTVYAWQGKGVEPIHPNVERSHHRGFMLQNPGLEMLQTVWEQYEIRQELLEQGMRDFAPILLIITDWQSIKDLLESQDPKLFKEVAAKLMVLVNNGAALGTTVWLDTQSPNIKDWGLGSASIRDNFDIFAIARIGKDANGETIGDTKCVSKILENQYLVPNERDRASASEQYNLLLDGMQQGKIKTSVILSTAGVVRLGITPEFERKALQFGTVPPQEEQTDTIAQIVDTIMQNHTKSDPDQQTKPNQNTPKHTPEQTLKDKVQNLVLHGYGYIQICETLWPGQDVGAIAPVLGENCRRDGIDILSQPAKLVLDCVGFKWAELDSVEFLTEVLARDLTDEGVAIALRELQDLGYIERAGDQVRRI